MEAFFLQQNDQPVQLDVAHTFYCQLSGGADAVIVSIEVELKQMLGLIERSADEGRFYLLKPIFFQRKISYKGIHYPHRIISCYPFFKGEGTGLRAVFTTN